MTSWKHALTLNFNASAKSTVPISISVAVFFKLSANLKQNAIILCCLVKLENLSKTLVRYIGKGEERIFVFVLERFLSLHFQQNHIYLNKY